MSDSSEGSSPITTQESRHFRQIAVDDSRIIINTDDRDELRSSGEEAWSDEAETLAVEWAQMAKKKANSHIVKGCKHGLLHNIFGLPSVLLPVTLAAATPLIDVSQSSMIIQVSGYIAIAILTGINTFYNFDKKKTEHEHYQARYNELHNDIRYQLFKSRRFRIPSDEFMARVQVKLASLEEHEP